MEPIHSSDSSIDRHCTASSLFSVRSSEENILFVCFEMHPTPLALGNNGSAPGVVDLGLNATLQCGTRSCCATRS